MDDPRCGHHGAVSALLYPFHMPHMAAVHTNPQSADIIGALVQGLGALGQDRQGEV